MTDNPFLVYQPTDGTPEILVRLDGETVWLTQQQMAELFSVTPQNITQHIRAIYAEGELEEPATCKSFLQVRQEGSRQIQRSLQHYNLDVIISVGYRVRSKVGTQFRIWATQQLRDFLVKGFLLNDRRFKEDPQSRYFEELLQRIRDIRSSEKVFWRKRCSTFTPPASTTAPTTRPPNGSSPPSRTRSTGPPTATPPRRSSPSGATQANRTPASPTSPATAPWPETPRWPKNYLTEEELNALNRIVTLYLDFAELQALNRRAMTMAEWIGKLDDFLRLTEREILTHPGTISRPEADRRATEQFNKWRALEANRESQADQDFQRALEAEKQISRHRKGKD